MTFIAYCMCAGYFLHWTEIIQLNQYKIQIRYSELCMHHSGAVTDMAILEVNRWCHKMKQASLLKYTQTLRTFMSAKSFSLPLRKKGKHQL